MFFAIERETSVNGLIANLENNQQALADWSEGGVLMERFGELSVDGQNHYEVNTCCDVFCSTIIRA